MREIKFRIWDTIRNEWLHDTAHAVNILGENVMLGELWVRSDGTPLLVSEIYKMEVMQFTGLYDMQGVPIFEGDIIDVVAILGAKSFITKVEWDNDLAMYMTGHSPLSAYARQSEIIGNIYEHSELLK